MSDSKAIAVTSGSSNVELYRASTDAATMCRDIVVNTAKMIGDRKYVQVEGWQAIAVAHGCTASARAVEAIEGGVRAIGEIRRMSDGAIIAEAEGFVGEDEPVWYGGTETKSGRNGTYTKTYPRRAMYAIRAMAQTRAISRACRSAFAHVVVMMNAGLSTTPAEEVPEGGFVDADFTPVQQAAQPKARADARPTAKQTAQAEADPEDIFAEVSKNFSKCATKDRLDAGMAFYKDRVFPGDLPKLAEIYNDHLARIKEAEAKSQQFDEVA